MLKATNFFTMAFGLMTMVFGLTLSVPAYADESAANNRSGEQLMEKGGCLSCHRVDQKLIGPPFKAVAEKYRKDGEAAAYLFEKVREGGEGVWGDIPMVPNGANKITDADLHAVIDWVLSL